jgi:PAS domain S-box-containing protein
MVATELKRYNDGKTEHDMRYSIRRRLGLVLLGLSIVPVLVVELVVAYLSFSLQRERTIRSQEQTARHAATHLATIVDEIEHDLRMVARLRAVSEPTLTDQDLLSELLSQRDALDELVLLDRAGRERVRVARRERVTAEELQDRSATDEFQMTTRSGTAFLSPVWFDEATGEPMMMLAVPVVAAGSSELNGVIAGNLRLSSLWDGLVAEIGADEGRRVYLVDSQSRIVADGDPPVASPGARFTVPEKPGFFKLASRPYAALAFDSLRLWNREFSVVVERPVHEALAQLLAATLFMAVCVLPATLLVAILVAKRLTRKIVEPIRALSAAAQGIEQGDLSRRAEVLQGDEIGDLAKAFNGMASQLQASLESLENQVAERRQVAEALRASQERHRELFENASDIVYTVDLNERLTSLNRAGEQLTGYTRAEAFEMNLDQLMAPDCLELAREMIQRKLAGEPPTTYEIELIAKDGHTIPLEASTRLVFEGGRPVAVQGIARDITERKRAEEERLNLERQVQHVQKLEGLGILAGGIAHDFNNILMAILGYADLALQDLSPTHPARQSVKEIEEGTKRAAELTGQMLAYSGRGRFAIETVHLPELLDDMAHLLRTSISRKITLNLHLDRGIPRLEADIAQMQQVVLNLIINASEAIGDASGTITLSTGQMDCTEEYLAQCLLATASPGEERPAGAYVYLEVSDTGCGMDEEVKARIFDPFFTTKFTGRGLGMASVSGILRGHKGAIAVDSEPGNGTTVTVLLPFVDRPVESPEVGPSEVEQLRGAGTILLVDDEEAVRKVAKLMLERAGYRVLVAADGNQAIDLFRQDPDEVSCVLLDLTMPRMSGEATFQQLRRLRDDVRVILSSGYSEEEATEHFAGKGLSGFIQKPYQSASLRAKLREVLQ